MRTLPFRIALAWLWLLPLPLGAAEPAAGPDLLPSLEKLHLNGRYLTDIYEKLHGEAIEAASETEAQRIQMAYTILNEAVIRIDAEIEILSLAEAIRPERLSDFLTLRRKSLAKTRSETAHRITLLNLYAGFLPAGEARGLIEESVSVLQADLFLMDRVRERLGAGLTGKHPPEGGGDR